MLLKIFIVFMVIVLAWIFSTHFAGECRIWTKTMIMNLTQRALLSEKLERDGDNDFWLITLKGFKELSLTLWKIQ